MSGKHLQNRPASRQGGRRGLVIMLLSFASIVAAVAITRLAIPFITGMGIDEDLGGFIVRSALAIVAFMALGGASWLRFSGASIRRTWSIAKFILIINAMLGIPTALILLLSTGLNGDLAPGLPGRIAYSVALCLFVGINEEVMFRGLAFCGALAWLGHKKHGVAHAALLSSLAFGFVHVMADIDFSSLALTATGTLKIVETCMFALILCRGVFETRNLWGSITAHGFFDWALMAPATIMNREVTGTYATADPDKALVVCVAYLIVSLVYLPSTIKAVKALRAAEPSNGPLMEA